MEDHADNYRRAAERGDPEAMFKLGNCYKEGRGVPADAGEAAQWYRRAAEAGHAKAMYSTAVCFWNGNGLPKDKALAAQWAQKAADAGNANGMNLLGMCYMEGQGFPKSRAEAARWYRQGAEAASPLAMHSFGVCLWKGQGIPKDATSAQQWIRKAADAGNAPSMMWLSDQYALGDGVPQDDSLAAEWCTKAADLGDVRAVVTLGDRSYSGKGVQQDYGRAVHLYKLALEKSEYAGAMVGLGMCFLEGRGVPRNVVAALGWLLKASAKGYGPAMVALGRCYELGLGVAKSWEDAASWYRKAGDRDSPLGMGACYQHGLGVSKDLAKARSLSVYGATVGNPVSLNVLARLDKEIFAHKLAAAEVGDKTVLVELGVLYERGQGVTKNLLQALACYIRAGDVTAAERVRALIAADPVLSEHQALRRKRGVPDDVREDVDEQPVKARRTAIATERRERDEHASASVDIAERWAPTRLVLADCPACLQRIGRGQSVLLKECLHALCRACTTHMLERATPFACPVCEVPASPAADLPQHPLVESISAAAAGPLARECTNCLLLQDGDGGLAEFTCATCNRWLCDDHARRHRKAASTAAHALEPVPSGSGASATCAAHGQPFEAYCASETCRTVVCAKCLTTTHPIGEHMTRIVDDAFVAAYRARLTAGAAAARTAADEMVQRAADAALTLSDVDKRDAALRDEINRSMDALSGILEARRAALHAELEATSRAEQGAVQALREADGHRWRLMDSAAAIAEQVAASPAVAVLVQLEPAATARTAAVAALAPTDPVPFASSLRLDLGDADRYLSRLGRIVREE